MLSTGMLVGGVVGFVLDNTVPGKISLVHMKNSPHYHKVRMLFYRQLTDDALSLTPHYMLFFSRHHWLLTSLFSTFHYAFLPLYLLNYPLLLFCNALALCLFFSLLICLIILSSHCNAFFTGYCYRLAIVIDKT